MKKHISYLLTLLSFTPIITHAQTLGAQIAAFTQATNTPYCSVCGDQSDFAKIICQPVDQMVAQGSNATFTVMAVNGPLTYQWLKNGAALAGQTNSTLTIANAQISDVGMYSCHIYKDIEGIPTRSASLMVYSNWVDSAGVDPVTVYGMPMTGSGGGGTCPGPYVGYINYTKTIAQGWGWAPDTAHTNVFTAVDTNSPNTKIQYGGEYGDSGCAQTSVVIPNPPFSPVYRFTIYFTNSVPTNPYPITLDGFLP